MSLVWIVITNRVYDGDTVYGVFNSKERAEEALKQANDDDAEIRTLTMNEFLANHNGFKN